MEEQEVCGLHAWMITMSKEWPLRRPTMLKSTKWRMHDGGEGEMIANRTQTKLRYWLLQVVQNVGGLFFFLDSGFSRNTAVTRSLIPSASLPPPFSFFFFGFSSYLSPSVFLFPLAFRSFLCALFGRVEACKGKGASGKKGNEVRKQNRGCRHFQRAQGHL